MSAEDIRSATTTWGVFSYHIADGIGNSIAQENFWEPWLKEPFDSVPPGSTVVDVGANLGWFTIYAAKRGCRVFAFEPCLEVFYFLKKNVEDNGLQDMVSMFPLALYSRCEEMTATELGPDNPANQIWQDGHIDVSQCHNSGSFALHPGTGRYCNQYAVPLDFFRLENVSLIKTDTEGMDLEVLQGMTDTIRRCQPILCYEYLGPIPEQDASRLVAFNAFIDSIGYVTQEAFMGMEGRYRDFIAKPKVNL